MSEANQVSPQRGERAVGAIVGTKSPSPLERGIEGVRHDERSESTISPSGRERAKGAIVRSKPISDGEALGKTRSTIVRSQNDTFAIIP